MKAVQVLDFANGVVGNSVLMNVPIDCADSSLQKILEARRSLHDELNPDGHPAELGWADGARVWHEPGSSRHIYRLREVHEDATEIVCGAELSIPFAALSPPIVDMVESLMTAEARDVAGQIIENFITL
jgi:hypothetical protein